MPDDVLDDIAYVTTCPAALSHMFSLKSCHCKQGTLTQENELS